VRASYSREVNERLASFMGEGFKNEGRSMSLYYRVCARMPTNVTNRAAKEALGKPASDGIAKPDM